VATTGNSAIPQSISPSHIYVLILTCDSIDVGRNVCHGSDSVENAKKEIALWFDPKELVSWKSAQFDWVYEKP
jgi:nucleoside diphosphate kinase